MPRTLHLVPHRGLPPVGSMQPLNRAWSQVGRLALYATANRDSRSGTLVQRAPTHLLPVAHRAPRPPSVSTRAPTSSGCRTFERTPPQFHPSLLGTTSTSLQGGWGGTELCVQQQDLPLRLTPPLRCSVTRQRGSGTNEYAYGLRGGRGGLG